jgi:hypothetical protein
MLHALLKLGELPIKGGKDETMQSTKAPKIMEV